MLRVTRYMVRNLILIIVVAGMILLIVPPETVKNIPLAPDVKQFLDTKVSFAFNKWVKPTLESVIGDVFNTAEDAIQKEVQDTLDETEQDIKDRLN